MYQPAPPLEDWMEEIGTRQRVLDLGCGSGRDIHWLTQWHRSKHVNVDVTAVDHELKALEKVKLWVPDVETRCLRFMHDGSVRDMHSNEFLSFAMAFQPKYFDLIMCLRYLPPRSILQQVLKLVSDGGYFLMYHFVDDGIPGTWILDRKTETTAKFTHPKTYAHILHRHELSALCSDGFTVLHDEIRYLHDGRPMVWFLARKNQK
jgi:SAM-dependent methyltransferase